MRHRNRLSRSTTIEPPRTETRFPRFRRRARSAPDQCLKVRMGSPFALQPVSHVSKRRARKAGRPSGDRARSKPLSFADLKSEILDLENNTDHDDWKRKKEDLDPELN